MKITEALIDRFLNNECNEEEKKAVREYLTAHPELLDKLLTEHSWKNFEPGNHVPESTSKKMLQTIRQQTYHNRNIWINRFKWTAAAAAAVTIIFSIPHLERTNTQRTTGITALRTDVNANTPDTLQYMANNTGKTISFSLHDGSAVELAPGSELRYAAHFVHRRDLYLKGEAVFHVVKDPAKPFTVYAGRLATTALGTVFKVIAPEKKLAATRVHLLSGKVMVVPDSLLKTKGIQTAYLEPGQELSVDLMKGIASISSTHQNEPLHPATVTPVNVKMTFHNEPLENIFASLSQQYHVKISFHKELLTGMSFTGEFDSHKESLTGFIQTTCALNNLQYRQQNKVIYITGQ